MRGYSTKRRGAELLDHTGEGFKFQFNSLAIPIHVDSDFHAIPSVGSKVF